MAIPHRPTLLLERCSSLLVGQFVIAPPFIPSLNGVRYSAGLLSEPAKIDVLIYVSRLDETRFRPDEKRTIYLLTEKLGALIWNKAWLIFTFAASVPNENRHEASVNRKEQIENFVKAITSQYGLNPPFQGFQVKLRVDNTSKCWTSKSIPIMSVLTKVS